MNTKDIGYLGEKLACEYLVKNRYKILGRNYGINFGEIDIIAKKKGLFADKTIHFVEVKSLSDQGKDSCPEQSVGFFPEQRVDFKKQNKYKRLVEVWLEKNKFPQSYPCQVDIIAISGNPSANLGQVKIYFFENIISS